MLKNYFSFLQALCKGIFTDHKASISDLFRAMGSGAAIVAVILFISALTIGCLWLPKKAYSLFLKASDTRLNKLIASKGEDIKAKIEAETAHATHIKIAYFVLFLPFYIVLMFPVLLFVADLVTSLV
jgi:hypothetical protein